MEPAADLAKVTAANDEIVRRGRESEAARAADEARKKRENDAQNRLEDQYGRTPQAKQNGNYPS